MYKQPLPPDLVESIINTIMIVIGYGMRWLQNILSKKNKPQ